MSMSTDALSDVLSAVRLSGSVFFDVQRRRSSFARIFGRNSPEPRQCPNASTSTTRIARQSVKRLVNYSGSVCEQNLHCRYPLLRKLTVFASRTANPPQPFPAYNTRPRPSHTQADDISRSSLGFGDEKADRRQDDHHLANSRAVLIGTFGISIKLPLPRRGGDATRQFLPVLSKQP